MKKVIVLFLALLFLLAGCSGVAQADYDDLKGEYEELEEEYKDLEKDCDKWRNSYTELFTEYSEYRESAAWAEAEGRSYLVKYLARQIFLDAVLGDVDVSTGIEVYAAVFGLSDDERDRVTQEIKELANEYE